MKVEIEIEKLINLQQKAKELENNSKELENNSKELELYKKALDYACYRLETLDMGSSHSWKARTWKKVILEKVREE